MASLPFLQSKTLPCQFQCPRSTHVHILGTGQNYQPQKIMIWLYLHVTHEHEFIWSSVVRFLQCHWGVFARLFPHRQLADGRQAGFENIHLKGLHDTWWLMACCLCTQRKNNVNFDVFMIIYLIHSLQSWLILCGKNPHWYPIIPPLISIDNPPGQHLVGLLGVSQGEASSHSPGASRRSWRYGVSWKWMVYKGNSIYKSINHGWFKGSHLWKPPYVEIWTHGDLMRMRCVDIESNAMCRYTLGLFALLCLPSEKVNKDLKTNPKPSLRKCPEL